MSARRFAYWLVEGIHDVEWLARILKIQSGHDRVKFLEDLDPFWHPLVPRNFPFTTLEQATQVSRQDLLRRAPIPLFLQTSDQSSQVAIHFAGGISKIVETLQENYMTPGFQEQYLDCVAVILDADDVDNPQQRCTELIGQIVGIEPAFAGLMAGQVSAGKPRCGVFVLPNNQHQGTLEDLLKQCAAISYPDLLTAASDYLQVASPLIQSLAKADRKDFNKPAGPNKALIGSMASLMRPGKAIQVSLQDNQWLSQKTLQQSFMQPLLSFLAQVI